MVKQVDYAHFNFGERLHDYIDEVFNHGGIRRTEEDLTDGQKVFLNAVRRELAKYTEPPAGGYPANALEQFQSFCRTIGDLHNSYFDAGLHKISDCLFKRWNMLYDEAKKLEAADGASQPCWWSTIGEESTPTPAFFDA